jgi:hypothetical protein
LGNTTGAVGPVISGAAVATDTNPNSNLSY